MKKLLILTNTFLLPFVLHAQNNTTPKKNDLYVRETVNITQAAESQKNKPGISLLTTTKSGYKIYLDNTNGSPGVIIVKDSTGNTVTTTARRKVVKGLDGIECLECYTINRGGKTSEECYRVQCTALEKELAGGSGRTNR